MKKQLEEILQELHSYVVRIINDFAAIDQVEELCNKITGLSELIDHLSKIYPAELYGPYEEFFCALEESCKCCGIRNYFESNAQQILNSIDLFRECLETMKEEVKKRIHTCTCCGSEMICPEDQEVEFECGNCNASIYDQALMEALKQSGLLEAEEGKCLLVLGTSSIVVQWICKHAPQLSLQIVEEMVCDWNHEYEQCDLILAGSLGALSDFISLLDVHYEQILKPDGRVLLVHEKNIITSIVDVLFLKKTIDYSELKRTLGWGSIFLDSLQMDIFSLNEKTTPDLKWEYKVNENLCENGPLVSVVLSCYNHEKYVARSIESVIHQSYKNIEFLVADDASLDNTPSIMKRYSQYFTKAWYFNENGGGRTVFLAEQSTGKYIAILHSDDYWEKDKLALQVDYLEKHEKCGACLTWSKMLLDSGEEYAGLMFIQPNRSSAEWLRFFWENGNALCNPSSVTRRDLYFWGQKHGKSCRQFPDLFKWIDTVQNWDIHIITKILTWMSWHPAGSNANTSAPSSENSLRLMVEEGINWPWVLRDMDDSLFVEAFGEKFRNEYASTREELLCEKIFLMISSTNPYMKICGLSIYADQYMELRECLENTYHYFRKDYDKDKLVCLNYLNQ